MQIVNLKSFGSIKALNQAFGSNWVYIGRPNAHFGLPGSALANPYMFFHEYQRKMVIKMYSEWLWSKVNAADPAVLNALGKLSAGSVLVCWCAPKPCHGQIVASVWASLFKKE